MNEETFQELEQYIRGLEPVLSVLPGDSLLCPDFSKLSEIADRQETGDLRLVINNIVKLEHHSASVLLSDILSAAVSIYQLRVLVEQRKLSFDQAAKQALIREYLKESTALHTELEETLLLLETCPESEKEKLKQKIQKEQALISTLEQEIQGIKQMLGTHGKRRNLSSRINMSKNQVPKSAKEKEKVHPEEGPMIGAPLQKKEEKKEGWFQRLKRKTQITQSADNKPQLPEGIGSENTPLNGQGTELSPESDDENDASAVPESQDPDRAYCSKTTVGEEPDARKKLRFERALPCKDVPGFSLIFSHGEVLFGLAECIEKRIYHNEGGTLYRLHHSCDAFVMFMTADYFIDSMQQERFQRDELEALQDYYCFMTWVFENNLGQKATIQEYLNFQEYYNRLSLSMIGKEKTFQKKRYEAMSIVNEYQLVMYAYQIAESDPEMKIVENLMNDEKEPYIRKLHQIKESAAVDPDFMDYIQVLIMKMESFGIDEEEATSVEPQTIQEMKTLSDRPELEQAYEELSMRRKEKVILKVQITDAGHKKEEACFAFCNVVQAVYDYLNRTAANKELVLCIDSFDVPLFGARNGSVSVPLLNEDIKHQYQTITGTKALLLETYERFLMELMQWIMEDET